MASSGDSGGGDYHNAGADPMTDTIDVAALVERLGESAGLLVSHASKMRHVPPNDNDYTDAAGRLREAATTLQRQANALAEARRELAAKEHMWLYECGKHANWLEKFKAEQGRRIAAEASLATMREALEELVDTLTPASYPAMKDPAHHDEIKHGRG